MTLDTLGERTNSKLRAHYNCPVYYRLPRWVLIDAAYEVHIDLQNMWLISCKHLELGKASTKIVNRRAETTTFIS